MKQLHGSMAGLVTFLALFLFSGCYHMRMEPAPLEPASFTVSTSQQRVLANIRLYLESYGMQVEETDESIGHLLTAPLFFYKESGANQPAGGRDYYCKIEVRVETLQDRRTFITLLPVDLTIRTDYVYNADGQVLTASKNYPYRQYPSMFDLQEVNRAMQKVMNVLRKNLG